jgi:NAD-specific glutamate dehydrogenase
MGGLTDDFYIQQAALTLGIVSGLKKGAKLDRGVIDKWFSQNAERTEKITQIMADLKTQPKVDLEMLVLVSQRLGQLVHQTK